MQLLGGIVLLFGLILPQTSFPLDAVVILIGVGILIGASPGTTGDEKNKILAKSELQENLVQSNYEIVTGEALVTRTGRVMPSYFYVMKDKK